MWPAGGEGNLRTPCLVRWPGHIPPGSTSDEIMHVVDWFPTILAVAGLEPPIDRVIDGVDQLAWLTGYTGHSQREGYLYWMGPSCMGPSGATSSWSWPSSATCRSRRSGCPPPG
jgi:arylsulfatase